MTNHQEFHKGDWVKYSSTGAKGVVLSPLCQKFSVYDGDLPGPWAQVQFDDGLRCWVRTEELEISK